MHGGIHEGRLAALLRSIRERWWPARCAGARAGAGADDDDRPPLRWQLSRRAVLASLVVAVVSVVAAVAWVLAGAPRTIGSGQPVAVAATSAADGARPAGTGQSLHPGGSLKSPQHTADSPPSQSSSTMREPLVVDVIGRVRRPGVYRLPPGARVEDAVKAAGGLAPGANADSVNLARRLSDGEQISVGVPGAPVLGAMSGAVSGAGSGTSSGSASGGGPDAGGSAAGQPIDLNTATAQQLDALPGVGPALAQRIVEFRQTHGRFSSVEDLKSVSGIGDAKFAQLRGRVSVG